MGFFTGTGFGESEVEDVKDGSGMAGFVVDNDGSGAVGPNSAVD